MKERLNVGVLGSGSWATAIVKMLSGNNNHIHWFIRNADSIKAIKKFRHNPHYLSSVEIDTETITFYNDIVTAIRAADYIFIAIPSPFLHESLIPYKERFDGKTLVSAVKGIIPDLNLTIAEFFNQQYHVQFKDMAILSGPCHAEEIALERLSYLTVASAVPEKASAIMKMLQSHFLRLVPSSDIYGIEYAAVLKNIMAIAAGICHGLGYGDNFQAVLIANASQEIKRFLDKTYKSNRKVNSSAYLGDLLVTAYSQFSRNRAFGNMIGKGYTIKSAQLELNMVAEGFYAARCIKELNKIHKVYMPILDAVYNIIHEKISPVPEIKILTEKLK